MARTLFRYDDVIGYRFVPGLKGRVRHEGGGYLVRANSDGFRNGCEFRRERTPGKSRILVFGDSNTAGDGVSNGKRFSDHLERAFPDVEVYNFGLPSSGTDQQYLAYREVGSQIEHDLVLICPMVDNIRRNLQDARVIRSNLLGELACLPKPYFRIEDGSLVLHNSPVPKGHLPLPKAGSEHVAGPLRSLARQVMAGADRHMPGLRDWSRKMRRLALPEEYNSPDHPGWQLMSAILTKWVSEAKAPVAICPIPTFDHIFERFRSKPYRNRFEELSSALNVPVIDMLPDLHRIPEAERIRLRFPFDEHPTEEGHAVFGRIMAEKLARYLPNQLKDAS